MMLSILVWVTRQMAVMLTETENMMVGDEQRRWEVQEEDHEFGFGYIAFEEPMEHPNGDVWHIYVWS